MRKGKCGCGLTLVCTKAVSGMVKDIESNPLSVNTCFNEVRHISGRNDPKTTYASVKLDTLTTGGQSRH